MRIDATGGWDVEAAVTAIHALDRAAGGLEYVEQPCGSLDELAAVRRRVAVRIAADESIRHAADPLRVRRALRWKGTSMTEPGPQSVGTTTHPCESCGMPIETGRWCTYCTTDSGDLQPFEERFARMVAWQERRHPEQSRADAEAATLAYLATMPAWRDHPQVTGRG